jgi:hypothetical protein
MTRGLILAALLAMQGVPAFDTSGLDAFWVVQGRLVSGTEPTPVEWDAVFRTPGYAALEERERRRAALTQAMRLAYMPALSAQRDSAIRTNAFTGRSAKHLMGVPAAKDSISRFLATLRATGALGVARTRVAGFVPAGLTDSVAPPPVALTFFLDDGRGYPTIIVADLLRLTRAGVDTAYFAHEFYHFYRRRFAAAELPIAPRDSGLVELLAYPVEEGLADQLDKRRFVDLNDAEFAAYMARPGALSYAPGYRDAYGKAATWLAAVSRAVERGIAKPDSATIFVRAMRDSIPDQGRALGAYMARTIDRVRGRDALIRASRGTIAFWAAYDEAAAASSGPRATIAAMNRIRSGTSPAPRNPE